MIDKRRKINKKRNTALVYEFLVRTISRALVDGDQKKSTIALNILKKYYKPGTEIYREFKLANALIKTTVNSEAVAASILSEAKSASRGFNLKELDREKSFLIKSINCSLNGDEFFDQHVDEYKVYSTIQSLLNDWRSHSTDIERLAEYEDKLVSWLVQPKTINETLNEQFIPNESPGTMRVLMKVMMKKLNEKYGDVLTEGQKSILRSYAFATVNKDDGIIHEKLQNVRDDLVTSIDTFLSESGLSAPEKLKDVKSCVMNETLDSINDETVSRFMLYLKLDSELRING